MRVPHFLGSLYHRATCPFRRNSTALLLAVNQSCIFEVTGFALMHRSTCVSSSNPDIFLLRTSDSSFAKFEEIGAQTPFNSPSWQPIIRSRFDKSEKSW
ncbi:MAG TPA: hypothetical protein DEV93_16480 [Chloroflexi bacterium]|nr:hypothetical protein [Chloroflexota bacterium]